MNKIVLFLIAGATLVCANLALANTTATKNAQPATTEVPADAQQAQKAEAKK